MRPLTLLAAIAVASTLAGCVAQPKYNWGNYERSLYSFYKDPAKADELAASLKSVIEESESTTKPVAPGIYAEYGYLLLQQGKSTEAIGMFEKEKTKWPEATHLMNSMIQAASTALKKPTPSKE
ncbi:MAG: DUF4810 domain-containing protein [Pseudomonadota bacterium]